jgi:hypothetical protein
MKLISAVVLDRKSREAQQRIFAWMFTTEPNLEPYTALPTDPRVFDPARASFEEGFSTAFF